MKKKFLADNLEWLFMTGGLICSIIMILICLLEIGAGRWEWPAITSIWIVVAMKHKSEAEDCKKSSEKKSNFYK
jgi:hypothetical protein